MKTDGEAQLTPSPTAIELHQRLAQPLQKAATKRWWWLWLLVLPMLGYGGYRLLKQTRLQPTHTTPAALKPIPQSIPVVVATARQGDLPIYLTGLGSVTPLNTVTVRSRVDGQLMSVRFQEGRRCPGIRGVMNTRGISTEY